MHTLALIQSLLDGKGVDYRVEPYSASTVGSRSENRALGLARVAMCRGDSELLLAIYPASQRINLTALQSLLRHPLRLLAEQEANALATRLAGNAPHPSFRLIVDSTLTNNDRVRFDDAAHRRHLDVATEHLLLLADDTLIGSAFCDTDAIAAANAAEDADAPRLDLRERLQNLRNLPVVPEMAQRILALRANPNATVHDLANIVALDSALAAQVLRYANSALFGRRGSVNTLQDAILRVLGFETVMCLALGVATAKTFRLAHAGPLGMKQLWQHGVYNAALSQRLAQLIPKSDGSPRPGLAYLGGLLHDVGFLVLGQLFPPEYFWLNKLVAAKPETPVTHVEKQLLGLTHGELGSMLTNAWHMPTEIAAAVGHHHDPDYDGPHAVYAHIVQLSDRLLKSHGLSDAASDDLPPALLERLGLSEEDAVNTLGLVVEDGDTLKTMAAQLVA